MQIFRLPVSTLVIAPGKLLETGWRIGWTSEIASFRLVKSFTKIEQIKSARFPVLYCGAWNEIIDYQPYVSLDFSDTDIIHHVAYFYPNYTSRRTMTIKYDFELVNKGAPHVSFRIKVNL